MATYNISIYLNNTASTDDGVASITATPSQGKEIVCPSGQALQNQTVTSTKTVFTVEIKPNYKFDKFYYNTDGTAIEHSSETYTYTDSKNISVRATASEIERLPAGSCASITSTTTSFTFKGTAISGASNYKFYWTNVNTGVSDNIIQSSLTFQRTGLTPNCQYKVNYCGIKNENGYTRDGRTMDPSIVIWTLPNNPSSLTGTASTNSIDLSWKAPSVGGATYYQIQYKKSSASSSSWITVNEEITSTSYQLTGLEESTTYNIRCYACNGDGTTCATPATVNVTTTRALKEVPQATAFASVSVTSSSVKLVGQTLTNANRYEFYCNEDVASGGDSNTSPLQTSTTYTFTNNQNGYKIKPNTKYRINYTGFDYINEDTKYRGGTIAPSPTVYTLTENPSNLTGTSSETSVSLQWVAPSNGTVNYYKISYKKSSASSWTNVEQQITSTKFILEGLTSSTTYNVRCYAYNGDDIPSASAATANFTTTRALKTPAQPTKFDSVITTTNSIELKGIKLTNATHYTFYCNENVSSGDKNESPLLEGILTYSFINGQNNHIIKPGTEYRINYCGWDYVNENTYEKGTFIDPSPTVWTKMLAPTNFICTSKTHNTISLSWEAPVGATHYEASYMAYGDSLSGDSVINITDTKVTIEGLNAETVYIIDLIAYNGNDNNSQSSTSLQVETAENLDLIKLPAGSFISTSFTDTSVSFTGTEIEGAETYRFFIRYDYSNNEKEVYNTVKLEEPSFTYDKLSPNTKYAFNYAGVVWTKSGSSSRTGEWAIKQQIRTLSPNPTGLSATATGENSIKVTWTGYDGTNNYVIYWEKTSDPTVKGTKTITHTTGQTNYSTSITGLEKGTSYKIICTSRNDDGAECSDAPSTTGTTQGANQFCYIFVKNDEGKIVPRLCVPYIYNNNQWRQAIPMIYNDNGWRNS